MGTTTCLRTTPSPHAGAEPDDPPAFAGAAYRFFRGFGFGEDAAVSLTVRAVGDALTRSRLAAMPADRRVLVAVRATLRKAGVRPPSDERVEADWRRAVLKDRLARAVVRVRVAVSPDAWSAFRLTTIEGRPVAAAAELLGLSAGEVVVSKSRVLALLRDAVADFHGEQVNNR